MTSTLITAYLGAGLAAARPTTPAVAAGALAIYEATDTGALSVYYSGAWHTLASGDPTITPFLTIPANPGWDPAYVGPPAAIVLSNSNKRAAPASSSPYNHMMGTPARYTGKRYYEMVPGSTSFTAVGFAGPAGHYKDGDGNVFGNFVGQVGWVSSGDIVSGKTEGTAKTIATIQTFTTGDRLSFAIDLDAGLFWFRTNAGNWNNSGAANPATGVGGLDMNWALSGAGNKLIWPAASGTTANYDLFLLLADFTQAVPAGFTAWGA